MAQSKTSTGKLLIDDLESLKWLLNRPIGNLCFSHKNLNQQKKFYEKNTIPKLDLSVEELQFLGLALRTLTI